MYSIKWTKQEKDFLILDTIRLNEMIIGQFSNAEIRIEKLLMRTSKDETIQYMFILLSLLKKFLAQIIIENRKVFVKTEKRLQSVMILSRHLTLFYFWMSEKDFKIRKSVKRTFETKNKIRHVDIY